MRKVLAVAVLALCCVGCKDPYGASAKAGADIASGIASGMQTVQQLQQSGSISATEALNVAGYLEYANKGDEAFMVCVDAVHTAGPKAGSFTACANGFNATLNNPTELALIHVANTQASQNISTIVSGITTGVSLTITTLGGA